MGKEEAAEQKKEGGEQFRNKQYQLAIQSQSEAISEDPSDHSLFSNRSACYASLSKYKEALIDADKCIELNPTFVRGYSRKGAAHHGLGQYQDAINAYDSGLAFEPANEALLNAKNQSESALSNPSTGGGGGGMFGGGGMGGMLQQLMMSNPELLQDPEVMAAMNDQSLIAKMKMYEQTGNIQAMFSDPQISNLIQKFQNKVKKPEGFDEKANEYTSSHGHDPDAFNKKETDEPKFYENTKDPYKEEPKKKEEPKNTNKELVQLKDKATKLFKAKKFQEAYDVQQECDLKDPKDYVQKSNMIACMIEIKEYDDALELCNAAQKSFDEDNVDFKVRARILQRKGTIYLKQQKQKEAVEALEASLFESKTDVVKDLLIEAKQKFKEWEIIQNTDPELSDACNKEANALFKEKKFPEALKKYEDAIKHNIKGAKAYCNKAVCLIALLQQPSALIELDKCLELDPKYIKAQVKKALCHLKMKEFHKAQEFQDKALSFDPNNQEASQGKSEVNMAIQSGMNSGSNDEERYRHAMSDPEIQRILSDPQMQLNLKKMQEDPQFGMQCMQDPEMAKAINKLIAAGVIKTK